MVKNAESVLAAELIKLGFKRKGKRLFYLQIRDIIGLIAFERPTGLLYLQFAVIPLFFPCPGSIHYTFGNRLNTVYPGLPVLEKSADAEQINDFCSKASAYIRDDLIPFMEQLSTAAALRGFSGNGCKNTKYIFCDPEQLRQLHLYSCLSLRDYDSVLNAAREYSGAVAGINYTEEEKKKKRKACEALITALTEKQYSVIEVVLQKNAAENLALFTEM